MYLVTKVVSTGYYAINGHGSYHSQIYKDTEYCNHKTHLTFALGIP